MTTPMDSADTDADTDTDTDTGPSVDDPDQDYDGDGYTENEGDCDDTRSGVNPGAMENCKGGDLNCDGDPSDHCVRMEYSKWRRWSRDASGVLSAEGGFLWRGLDGIEYCRTVVELQVSTSPYGCPGCDYSWQQTAERGWWLGPACAGIDTAVIPGEVDEDPDWYEPDIYAYFSAWTGSWRGYGVTDEFAFLGYSPYSPGVWYPTFVGGLPYWDVYRYNKGDYEVVGYTWPLGRYVDTGFYYVDPTYP